MSKECSIMFWDVQHGHAAYVKTPNNRHIAIDLGTGDYSGKNLTFSPLRHLKYNYGVNQLDCVIITHPHLDHIDDILNFDLLNPKTLFRPKQLSNAEVMAGVRPADKPKFDKYCEINNRYSEPISETSADNISNSANWDGLNIAVYSPSTCDHNNFNNHSIVTVLEYAGTKVVIPGDNEKCSFDELLGWSTFQQAVKDSDVLLAPHHGRDSGFNIDFVNLVNPAITIVSDGRFCDTSANGRYSAKSRGWKVYKRNGTSSDRKCLTTNSDGEVLVKFGYWTDGQRFLNITIE